MVQDVKSRLDYITHWYQPIFDLESNRIAGYEALLRDCSSSKASPEKVFRIAEKLGLRNKLDLFSVKSALAKFDVTFSTILFVNIFPSTSLSGNFLSWWDENISSRVPVVLELSESEPFYEIEMLKTVIAGLKSRGVKIAIDDMGSGYSSVKQWIELDPDYVKLDRYYMQDLSTNTKKQKTISSMVDLFDSTAEIIVEGVENREDLDIVRQLGVRYAQGFYLGRPSPWEMLQLNC